MTYTITILPSAQKSLAKLSLQDYKRVATAVAALAANPRPPGCKKLQGRPGWRIRVGAIRIIYEIEDQQLVITVTNVGQRGEIYK